MDKCKIEALGL